MADDARVSLSRLLADAENMAENCPTVAARIRAAVTELREARVGGHLSEGARLVRYRCAAMAALVGSFIDGDKETAAQRVGRRSEDYAHAMLAAEREPEPR